MSLRLFAAAFGAAILLVSASSASSIKSPFSDFSIMDFERLEIFDASGQPLDLPNGRGNIFPAVYEEDGYRITASHPVTNVGLVYNTASRDDFIGSVAMYPDLDGAKVTLSRVDGRAFDFLSIALAPISSTSFLPSVNFTGHRLDGGIVTASFSLSGAPPSAGKQIFSFGDDFVGVRKVEWLEEPPYHQFDDMTLLHKTLPGCLPSGGVPKKCDEPSPVPLPASLPLMIVALGGLAIGRSRPWRSVQKTAGPTDVG